MGVGAVRGGIWFGAICGATWLRVDNSRSFVLVAATVKSALAAALGRLLACAVLGPSDLTLASVRDLEERWPAVSGAGVGFFGLADRDRGAFGAVPEYLAPIGIAP